MSSAPTVRYLALLSQVVAHIDAHLDEPLDAESLSRCAAMSRHHFHRVFRAHFGTTVAGYVTWRRLQRACELLAAPGSSVLQVALAVGYESSQALAKAMRRELATTPTAVRAGESPAWQNLFERRSGSPAAPRSVLSPLMVDLPPLRTLTATGRGMDGPDMTPAAQAGYAELMKAVESAGLRHRIGACIALFPDEYTGPDDPTMRMWCGALFDHPVTGWVRLGAPSSPPDVPLTGSLAWHDVPAGRHAVFTHTGPYDTLHATWHAIYADWLPATGYPLRDTPPFELYVNDPAHTPAASLRTDLYVPLA